MKRPGIALLFRIVVVTAALALSIVSGPQTASAGWTWDEMTAVVTSTSGDATPPADGVDLEGWTWDESAAPADGTEGYGWTWDEAVAPGLEPGPASAPPAPAPAP